MAEEKEEYWHCVIGPVKRSELPWGGDGPLRMAVKDAFYKMLGRWEEVCSSGWGVSKRDKDMISNVLMFGVTEGGKIRIPKNDKEVGKFLDIKRKENKQ